MTFKQGGTRQAVLITGASGFVGQALLERLLSDGRQVVALGRTEPGGLQPFGHLARWHRADLSQDPLDTALEGVGSVIHAAGVAHTSASEDVHRRVTVDGTRRLVEAMRRVGVPRLVFVSSIRAQVGGFSDETVRDAAPLRPTDPYGRAKRDAEEIVMVSGLDATVLRPVLVADVGARGNLELLRRLAASHVPLPFGGLTAKRSLISRAALADAVLFALAAPGSVGRRMNLADEDPLSVAEILGIFRTAGGRPPGLVGVPTMALRAALVLAGRSSDYDRLARPLLVAADGIRALGWSAPECARAALARMARAGR